MIPIDSAITGSPNTEDIFCKKELLFFSRTKKELIAIRIMGTTTGRKAMSADGTGP
jgi:hypothetical protein